LNAHIFNSNPATIEPAAQISVHTVIWKKNFTVVTASSVPLIYSRIFSSKSPAIWTKCFYGQTSWLYFPWEIKLNKVTICNEPPHIQNKKRKANCCNSDVLQSNLVRFFYSCQ